MQKAIEESMRMQDEEAKRRSQRTKEEDDLVKALRLSEDDETKRKRDLEAANANALFDDNLNMQSNNQYNRQPDLFVQQSQQMPMMPTGGWPLVDLGYGQQQLQPEYTSYNPFHAQMMGQQQQQQQHEEYMRQQMALQEQQRQQEEYMRQQYLLQQQQHIMAQPTGYGSNNPFAPGGSQNLQQQQQPSPQASSSFLPVPNVSFPQPPQQEIEPQQTAKPLQPAAKKEDGQHAGLADLLARGREDGMDTFGNTGNLRIPVGSGFHNTNRLALQQTGFGANNPFGQVGQQQKSNDQPFFSV